MVQIIDRQPTRLEGILRSLNQGISGLAEGGQALRGAMDERSTRNALAERFGDEFRKVRDQDIRKQMLAGAQEKENQTAKLKGEYQADEKNYKTIKDNFGAKFADIWLASPTGARTELIRAALEARARGSNLNQILGFQEENPPSANEERPPQSFDFKEEEPNIDEDLSQILESQDEELLPKEKIARGKERYATGLKEFQEAGTKLQGMTRDKERLEILQNLNASNKLPKSLGRLNVDKEGNLKLPFLGSPEAQRYVKTLNEFSAGAKDTFGSRVTNFDLAQYLKRYPTLLNTNEGRRQLLDQMKIVNQINSVYYKNLRSVYDKAGGVRNIDSDRAEKLAENLSEKKVTELAQKFKQIGQFTSKPNASEFKGKRIKDKETGEIFVSDGENWIPE